MAYNFKAGDRVRITDRRYNGHNDPPEETKVLGIVPNTNEGYVFVFLASNHGGYKRVVEGIEYPETYNVPVEMVELIRKPLKPVLAYTSACKICKAPARKINKTQLCSNARCKSRHSFKKAFPVSYQKPVPKDIDAEGFVICHECKERIHWHGESKDGGWLVSCEKKHTRHHKYLEGQKLAYKPIGLLLTTNYIRQEGRWAIIEDVQS
jgi:hypothetical protein